MAEKRGSIAFSATYRPPVPLDIFTCRQLPPTSKQDELPMTDGVSYNYNGQEISSAALKTILQREKLATEGKEADVDSGRLSGMVFVSERGGLETLHIALRFNDVDNPPKVKVFSLADVFGTDKFNGARMEDTGCIAGDHLVYVTTKDKPAARRQPWTAVYKTNLKTGKTDRLTPEGVADLSPSVQRSGKKIAVASFQRKGGWKGEIEDLQTDIFVMNVERPFDRRLVVKNGGWPTWGSDSVIFFHRKVGDFWGVFRADISDVLKSPTTPLVIPDGILVTPAGIDAKTPAAINATTVAVATMRRKSGFGDVGDEAQYRHIEIFDYSSTSTGQQRQSIQITQKTTPDADHFNPFVMDGGKRIGYHRSKSELLKSGDDIQRHFHKLDSPHPDVGLFRVPGIFPTFSKDGSQLAFVDNEFKNVWLADKNGLRTVFEAEDQNSVFSPVWNQNPEKDILYVNTGLSFHPGEALEIFAIHNVSRAKQNREQLTDGGFNNSSPSTNADGTKLVFRCTRDRSTGDVKDRRYKNLYIMKDAKYGEFGEQDGDKITRLTDGEWTDTHCQWSPSGDWIVFSSTRNKPKTAPEKDNGLDPGYFAVFLVNANDTSVVVRVMHSGRDVAGHVNHPFFSPDGKSIVVTADLAAVSADPISLPLFLHSVRPYGDIFAFDINTEEIKKNKNVKEFKRITHSRYENSTPSWTRFSTQDPTAAWNQLLKKAFTSSECRHMTGHLCIPKRSC